MKRLDPKAKWLFFAAPMTKGFPLLLPLAILAFLVFRLGIDSGRPGTPTTLGGEFFVVAVLFVILLIVYPLVSYVWAVLSVKNYAYEMTEDAFRKEYGIIWKKYVSIPYDRIQNVDIYRGVVSRLLGLSDLRIQTAGMSGGGGAYGIGSEGRLPGLNLVEAENLRNELIRKAKGSQVS